MATICHISTLHSQCDTRIFLKECSSLASEHEVYFIAPGKDDFKNNVRIRGLGNNKSNLFHRIFGLRKLLIRKIVEVNAQIYHLHDPELLLIAAKIKKMNKIVIFDSHEDTEFQIREKKKILKPLRPIVSWVYGKYQKYIFKKIDAVIVVTPHLIPRFKKIIEKVEIITNYPIYIDQNINRNPNNIKNDICYIGNSAPQWNHEVITQAVNHLSNVCFHIYGNFEKERVAEIKSVDSLNKVVFKGNIPSSIINKTISQYLVGMALLEKGYNTNFNKGTLGNTKLFEYMMSGIPVIATDFTIWNSIITKYNCGILVNPHNLKEVEEAIRFFVNNPKESILMGNNGRFAIKNYFNWTSEEKKLLKLYKDLLIAS